MSKMQQRGYGRCSVGVLKTFPKKNKLINFISPLPENKKIKHLIKSCLKSNHSTVTTLQYNYVTRDHREVKLSVTINRANPHPLLTPIHVPQVEVIAGAILPMSTHVAYELPHNVLTMHYFALLPLGADRTRLFHAHLRNFAKTPVLDVVAARAMTYVAGQDRDIIESLVPYDVHTEVSLRQDIP